MDVTNGAGDTRAPAEAATADAIVGGVGPYARAMPNAN